MKHRSAWIMRAGFLTVAAVLLWVSAAPASAQEPGTVRIAPSGPAQAIAFYLFAAITVVSCVGIAVTGNIVRMAVWLFGTLGSVAALYFLLAANLLGAIQLIVYAGGTLILIIFGVMLTSSSPWARFDVRRSELIAAVGIGLVLFAGLSAAALDAFEGNQPPIMERGASVAHIGEALLTTFLVPFEVASVLLLAVMIGAAYLARPEKQR